MNEDGTMARGLQLKEIAERFDLVILTIKDLIAYRRKNEQLVERIVDIQMPTEYGDFTAVAFVETLTGHEHIALVKGNIEGAQNVLVRVHSECLTGDVFGSCRCDCGPQLQAALAQIEKAGKGVLLIYASRRAGHWSCQ